MQAEEEIGFGAWRAVLLVGSLSLVGLAHALGGWACSSFNPLDGDGGGGVALVFFFLPLEAGAPAILAIWPLTKAAALASGSFVGGAFMAAPVGC